MSLAPNDKSTPKWLSEIQQNSYLPELMILGSVIFSLNTLVKDVENLSLTIKQLLSIPGGAIIFCFPA